MLVVPALVAKDDIPVRPDPNVLFSINAPVPVLFMVAVGDDSAASFFAAGGFSFTEATSVLLVSIEGGTVTVAGDSSGCLRFFPGGSDFLPGLAVLVVVLVEDGERSLVSTDLEGVTTIGFDGRKNNFPDSI